MFGRAARLRLLDGVTFRELLLYMQDAEYVPGLEDEEGDFRARTTRAVRDILSRRDEEERRVRRRRKVRQLVRTPKTRKTPRLEPSRFWP